MDGSDNYETHEKCLLNLLMFLTIIGILIIGISILTS